MAFFLLLLTLTRLECRSIIVCIPSIIVRNYKRDRQISPIQKRLTFYQIVYVVSLHNCSTLLIKNHRHCKYVLNIYVYIFDRVQGLFSFYILFYWQQISFKELHQFLCYASTIFDLRAPQCSQNSCAINF